MDCPRSWGRCAAFVVLSPLLLLFLLGWLLTELIDLVVQEETP